MFFLQTKLNKSKHKSYKSTPKKVHTPPDTAYEVPQPPKKRYEIEMMKDHVFFSSPIFPHKIPCQPSLSTTRDDHLIPIISLR